MYAITTVFVFQRYNLKMNTIQSIAKTLAIFLNMFQ